MKRVREVIVVEGRYDKNTVMQAVSGTIIETSGFGVFSDGEKLALLRRLCEKRGLIILTDSDKAGFFIRGRLRGILGDADIKHAYIPDIIGKEKRKQSPSKENKLGVEGMSRDMILDALQRAGATFDDEQGVLQRESKITKTDMFTTGYSGSHGAARRRSDLLKRLDLPQRLSANGLLDVLNILYTREEFLLLAKDDANSTKN